MIELAEAVLYRAHRPTVAVWQLGSDLFPVCPERWQVRVKRLRVGIQPAQDQQSLDQPLDQHARDWRKAKSAKSAPWPHCDLWAAFVRSLDAAGRDRVEPYA